MGHRGVIHTYCQRVEGGRWLCGCGAKRLDVEIRSVATHSDKFLGFGLGAPIDDRCYGTGISSFERN